MRVVHVIDSLDPAQGGPPAVVVRLAAAQARRSASIAVVGSAGSDDVMRSLREVDGVDRVHVARPPQLDEVVRSAAVVHIHGMWRPSLAAAIRSARRHGRPYLITPHGMLSDYALSSKPILKRLALQLFWRSALREARAVHLLSTQEQQEYRRRFAAALTAVVPNGVEPAEFAHLPARGEFKWSMPALAGREYVLFLARLHHIKGLDLLLQAFAALASNMPRLDLVVAGPDGGFAAQAVQLSNKLRLRDRVHFVGPLYGRAKLSALVDAACMCQPSRYEVFGLSIVEALACGVPVVVSDRCGVSDIVREGMGRIARLDANDIATQLAAVVSDTAALEESARQARVLALRNLTWDEIAARLLDLYAGMASRVCGSQHATTCAVGTER